jgi:hypothetical protein
MAYLAIARTAYYISAFSLRTRPFVGTDRKEDGLLKA